MENWQVIEAEDYYQALLRDIPKAKKRIVLAAMIVLWGERTAPLFILLLDALKRGVQVTILLDTYTRLPSMYDLQPRNTRSERVKQTFLTLEDLGRAGASVHSFGKIGFPPHKGRCHIKVTVIDNTSYSFGGVNFTDDSFKHTDYMLRTGDAETADCLTQLVARISKTRPPLQDGEVKLQKNTSILFDGGKPDHSIIYERACELTAQATRVYVASQMTPSGELAKLLHEKHATIYHNRPEQMGYLSSLAQAFDQQKFRIDNQYQGDDYIHAKIMLFELPNGRRALLSGSHNFSYRGVSFGTQEIALHSTDPKLWKQLHTFIQNRIASRKS